MGLGMKNKSVMQVSRLIGLARVMPKDRFVASHVNSFLVLDPRSTEDQGFAFQTAMHTGSIEDLEAPESMLEIFELVKTLSNPFADRISIGRASNCDVVLNDASISKLHAHIRTTDEFVVVDVGSRNGTFLNGDRIEANVAKALKIGDHVRFGTIGARIADAATVYDVIQASSAKS
jgi:hypothetical protein